MSARQNELEYARQWLRVKKVLSRKSMLRLYVLLLLLSSLSLAICSAMEYENSHFDSFFPRRLERPGSKHFGSFKQDSVCNESDWRNLQVMLTQDEKWYFKQLTAAEQIQMHTRVGENGRWNRFVQLITFGTFCQGVLFAAVFAIGIVLYLFAAPRFQWYSLAAICLEIGILVEILCRGYLSGIFE